MSIYSDLAVYGLSIPKWYKHVYNRSILCQQIYSWWIGNTETEKGSFVIGCLLEKDAKLKEYDINMHQNGVFDNIDVHLIDYTLYSDLIICIIRWDTLWSNDLLLLMQCHPSALLFKLYIIAQIRVCTTIVCQYPQIERVQSLDSQSYYVFNLITNCKNYYWD